MAKVYQIELLGADTQASFDGVAHSLLFANAIQPVYSADAANPNGMQLIVTSNVDSDGTAFSARYKVLADDSQSETSVDISTGKFVEGNLIAGIALLNEIQSDVRDYVAYNIEGEDYKVFVGVCNTTQSQDYTPAIIANSRVLKMISPAQVESLGL